MKNLKNKILEELKEHIPFTLFATILSMILISILLLNKNFVNNTIQFFYIFHPLHLFFSSVASTIIFYNYRKKILASIFVGVIISVAICSLSDVVFPYLGSLLFNIPTSFHLPEIELPGIIWSVAVAGGITGIFFKKTKFPHFMHVFISAFATLFYIFAYSQNNSILQTVFTFLIASVSVIIPCCLSDIVLPMLFIRRAER